MKMLSLILAAMLMASCSPTKSSPYKYTVRETAKSEFELHFESPRTFEMVDLKEQFRRKSREVCGNEAFYRIRGMREDVYLDMPKQELTAQIECISFRNTAQLDEKIVMPR